jgi:hypothetical protein
MPTVHAENLQLLMSVFRTRKFEHHSAGSTPTDTASMTHGAPPQGSRRAGQDQSHHDRQSSPRSEADSRARGSRLKPSQWPNEL